MRYAADNARVNGGASASAHVDGSTAAAFGTAVIVGIVVSEGSRYYRIEPDGSKTPIGYAPELDPTRRVNAQDCTKPVDPKAGNLMCQ